ncbi:bifunctional riboflavin kinase/FAD synthetase [Bacillus sp. AGMB 02131]|uniref:Riboflavin biosynthesis protein n=1 Tax=Peribacillus faecalis TaxID=2772559 RepID=A0A927CX80_9BACI|nr:bifunctional riboflavin kinase/FAD synthetase [Peribacillus faecalis]MBD3109397.1 bifunctional riboflavin kinase/FAD synthetase [Peribacillus faecalis]
MKVIELDYPHTYKKEDFPPLSIALGFFDGVHKGHQQVIQSAIETAKKNGWNSAVMTFYEHPLTVLGKQKKVQYITPLQDKISLIDNLGVDYLFIVHFSESFASLLPQQFVDQYLIGLHVLHVTAGFDYSYGRLGKGSMETMPFHSRGVFSQMIIDKISLGDEKVSSTAIRAALSEGKVDDFVDLAGRKYVTKGIVVHGDKRGRQLGFPTANVEMDEDYLIPANGVYAVKATVHNRTFNGICNIGFKPTFKNERPEKPSVEVHMLQFDEMIYDEQIAIEWHTRLRSEKKFSGIDEIIAQLTQDKQNAERYFKEM